MVEQEDSQINPADESNFQRTSSAQKFRRSFQKYTGTVIRSPLDRINGVNPPRRLLRNNFIESTNLNYFWQNGYAGKLALGWVESSAYPVLYLAGVIGMFILSFLRMFNVLSPLSFISGFFSILYNLLSFIAGKISRPHTIDFLPSRQLNDFKNNLRIEE